MSDTTQSSIQSTLSRVKRAGYWAVAIVLVVFAIAVIASGSSLFGGYRVFAVQSGSMAPAIPTGSLTVVHDQDAYQVGDVITYLASSEARPQEGNATVTHRIVATENTPDGLVYTTKGDANEDADLAPVSHHHVLGKVRSHIPYLGYPIAYAKTQIGFIVLIVIPATLIIYSECRSLIAEVKTALVVRKRRNQRARQPRDREQSVTVIEKRVL